MYHPVPANSRQQNPTMTRFCLIRHGETPWNAERRIQVRGGQCRRQKEIAVVGRDIQKQIDAVFQGKLFKTTVSKSVRLEESPAYRESIFTFAPRSTGASEYYSLTEEILERV